MIGQRAMEIIVLLLLSVPLTCASPLRPIGRPDADSVLSGYTVQAEANRPEEEHAPVLKIIPFLPEYNLDPLKRRMPLNSRLRRTTGSVCKLGTCLLQNLSHSLFVISKSKDKSEMVHSPYGYGR